MMAFLGRARRHLARRFAQGLRKLVLGPLGGRRLLLEVQRRSKSRRRVFTAIYLSGFWKHGKRRLSVSGAGSSLRVTAGARAAIETVIREYGIRSILDAPCGDFNWMAHVALEGVKYTGADIVGPLIRSNQRQYGGPGRQFKLMDIADEAPEAHDLIICRDCLQHLRDASVERVLRNFSNSGSRFLLVTSTPVIERNWDLEHEGDFRAINLRLPPFSLGDPICEFVDAESQRWEEQKHLLLYRLPLHGAHQPLIDNVQCTTVER